MEDIFYHHIVPYIGFHIFHTSNLSLLSKHNSLKLIQTHINKTHSAKQLNHRLYTIKSIQISLSQPDIHCDDVYFFIKYMISTLLQDKDLEIITNICFHKSRTIKVPKYVYSIPMLDHSSTDFFTNQHIMLDVNICSTYRLGIIQKQILLDNCPYAKALIY